MNTRIHGLTVSNTGNVPLRNAFIAIATSLLPIGIARKRRRA